MAKIRKAKKQIRRTLSSKAMAAQWNGINSDSEPQRPEDIFRDLQGSLVQKPTILEQIVRKVLGYRAGYA